MLLFWWLLSWNPLNPEPSGLRMTPATYQNKIPLVLHIQLETMNIRIQTCRRKDFGTIWAFSLILISSSLITSHTVPWGEDTASRRKLVKPRGSQLFGRRDHSLETHCLQRNIATGNQFGDSEYQRTLMENKYVIVVKIVGTRERILSFKFRIYWLADMTLGSSLNLPVPPFYYL